MIFAPESHLVFQAGQYLRYTLRHSVAEDRGESRCFTSASSPDEPLIRLTTRLSLPPSTFKRALARLEPPERVEAAGRFGRFVYDQTDRLTPLPIWLSGERRFCRCWPPTRGYARRQSTTAARG
jgi:ferredoxin-NADP reductase